MILKKRTAKIILSIVLLSSLMMPLGLNAMHFVIYHHEKAKSSGAGKSIDKQPDHFFCQYEFISEIVDNQSVFIGKVPFISFDYKTFTKTFQKYHKHLFNSLRAPPIA